MDDSFSIEGVRYSLRKSGNRYAYAECARTEDNRLAKIKVSQEGVARHPELDVEFHFN